MSEPIYIGDAIARDRATRGRVAGRSLDVIDGSLLALGKVQSGEIFTDSDKALAKIRMVDIVDEYGVCQVCKAEIDTHDDDCVAMRARKICGDQT